MPRLGPLLALIALTAQAASGHIVPIPPSLCDFEPLELQVPTLGLTGAAEVAGAADTMRILYDSNSSLIQVCAAPDDPDECGAVVPRPFMIGTAMGELALPAMFRGHMLASGDVTFTGLPVTVTVDGATATVPVTLTTGLVAVGDAVAEGTPLQGLGALTFVGVMSGDALPPPLAGRPLLLTTSCLPRPVPDKDQFVKPAEITSIAGEVTTTHLRLRARADIPTFQGSVPPPDFERHPTLVAVHVDGTTVASAVLSAGLHGSRHLRGTSDDHRAVVDLWRRSSTRLVLAVRLHGVTLPPETPDARVLVDLTVDLGGLLGRGEQLFHASRNGRRLR
jgi:hypothetical protein